MNFNFRVGDIVQMKGKPSSAFIIKFIWSLGHFECPNDAYSGVYIYDHKHRTDRIMAKALEPAKVSHEWRVMARMFLL